MADDNLQFDASRLPEGFIIRTKEGRLKIVRQGQLVDFSTLRQTSSSLDVGEKPFVPETVASPIPGAPQAMPQVAPQPTDQGIPTPLPKAPVVRLIPQTLQGEIKTLKPSDHAELSPSRSALAERSVLEPHTPVSSGTKSAYFVEPEDEQDILLHRQKLANLAVKTPEADLDAVIQNIIVRNAVDFPDDVMEKRFFNIVKSRLSEMRNSMETEEALQRSQKIGGMGFESDLARRLIVDIEEEASTLASQGMLQKLQGSMQQALHRLPQRPYAPKIPLRPPHPSMSIPEVERRPVISPPPVIEPRVVLSRPVTEVYQPTPHVSPAPMPSPRPVQAPPAQPSPRVSPGKTIPILQPVSTPESSIPLKVQSTPPPAPSPRPSPPQVSRPEAEIPQMRRPDAQIRQRISDIVEVPAVHKTLGPVEELADLDVTDFRRFGTTTEDAKRKILEKISLLEEESYAMRSSGIKAWRRSPLFQLYLDIGRESIETGVSVQQVIAARAGKKAPVLSNEEFDAIADINRLLRY